MTDEPLRSHSQGEWDTPRSQRAAGHGRIVQYQVSAMRVGAWAKHFGKPVEFANSIGMEFRLTPAASLCRGKRKACVQRRLVPVWPTDSGYNVPSLPADPAEIARVLKVFRFFVVTEGAGDATGSCTAIWSSPLETKFRELNNE